MNYLTHFLTLIVFVNFFSCKNESNGTIESAKEINQPDTIEQLRKEVKPAEIEEENPIQVLFEANYDSLKFTIEDEIELYIRAYDSTNILIDELNISHPYYKSLIFGQSRFEVLQKHKSNIQLMFYSQYGGDGEHTRETAKFIFFKNNKLHLIDEIVIFKPEISKHENRVSILGYYIISLCDVCDGWDAAEEDDIFEIPMNIEVEEEIKYYGVLNGEEREYVIKDFEQKVNRKIEFHLSKNDSSIFRITDKAKKEFYNLVNDK
jgi:hypothetical protein